ncbi:ABC-type lipoprotein export system ATPase subunit [Cryobacterium sp. CAN_C3]|nr:MULTISPECIES: hypothetical protein [unclassified Cryobacterium]MEC5154577.1 ABC-type lipoprotein export system ATPase subunit [Cryobacterium sp. CAN_C3]
MMGSSASGESALLTVAGGLTPPTSSEVVIEGNRLSQAIVIG